jgi:UDP-N-acetylmuramate dehydrogenase
MDIRKDVSLKPFNTFGVDVNARAFARIRKPADVVRLISQASRPLLVLGGGSNILFTSDVDKCVIHNDIPGIAITTEDSEQVLVEVGAGVVWHDLVLWAVNHQLGGIENLALIPGRVGAAPIQNIGAYGVELVEVFHHLTAVDLETAEVTDYYPKACQFGYRNSIFKNEAREKYCITHVYLILRKAPHRINDSYGAIRDVLKANDVDNPGIRDICNSVIAIRSSKLPDPAELGNSGSFFKNPVIPVEHWEVLRKDHTDLVYYPADETSYKIPAGWLIEQCGWKGKRVGNVGCYGKQALVIVNYGGASGQEIFDHAMRVQESVERTFGIQLEPEVNVM